jgi:hypothetical protein
MMCERAWSEVGEYFAQVVSGPAQNRVHGIACGAFEEIASEAAVGLHVADHRLDRVTPLEPVFNGGRQTSFRAGDSNG